MFGNFLHKLRPDKPLTQSRFPALFLAPALLAALSAAPAHAAQTTDAALSLYGAFSGTSSGNSVNQSPANAAGGMIELRHLVHPWLGFEGAYSFNRANQNYISQPAPCQFGPGPNCVEITSASISANAHEFTGDWVFSLKLLNLRPFAVVGAGVLLDIPTGGTYSTCGYFTSSCSPNHVPTSTVTKPVFVYGAGLDWGLLPHLGLRFQYRGNLYKAAALTSVIQSSNAFTQTAEPMIGAYFRF